MSFILEALKKSENKRRRKGQQRSSRSIHEPIPHSGLKSRIWILGILLLLLVNAGLILWFSDFWQQPFSSQTTEFISADTSRVTASRNKSKIPPVISKTMQKDKAPVLDLTQNQQLKEKEPSVVKALTVPRNENQVYSFGQLPPAIQKQIPALHMSLHAYNRDDASASMVQLNDRIMREGDMVADTVRLEQVTADGVVLRYDGYRFLLTRRGN